MNKTCTFTIDGMPAEAQKGTHLLDTLRALDFEIPTLCHHPSLEATGACRLCIVEVTHPDWKGWSGLVTSCLYPIEEGIIVSTRSQRVVETRRTLLEMLLARCPDAEAVRAVARAEGVDSSEFPVAQDADKCILCGLCVSVCQDLGPGALSTLDRGPGKSVGPRPDGFGEDCTGCAACAWICPTGEITLDRKPGTLAVWNREFDVPVASVRESACRACGICEAVCPVAIPRVAHRADGTAVASIAPDFCYGCGLCAGACPTGAIEQRDFPLSTRIELHAEGGDLSGRSPVFACSRSPFPDDERDLFVVPCVGQVTVEGILECLARGADGVLVMGRDKDTCLYGPGEDQAEERVAVANALAALAGLGPNRVAFVVPPAGREGPALALAAWRDSLRPSPLAGAPVGADLGEVAGLDRALALYRSISGSDRLHPPVPARLRQLFGDAPGDCETVLYIGDLPALGRLVSLLLPVNPLHEIMQAIAGRLAERGIVARVALSPGQIDPVATGRVIDLDGNLSIASDIEVIDIAELFGDGDDPSKPEPFRFDIGPELRRDLAERLRTDPEPLCRTPKELLQFALVGREGAWRTGPPVKPLLGFLAEPAGEM